MTQTPQNYPDADFSTVHEPNRIESRESFLQKKGLERLLQIHPELVEVKHFIESDARFESAAVWVHVNCQYRQLEFMKGEEGMLNGALLVADRRLLKRFDRQDLGLSKEESASEALDRHIPYVAQ